MKQALLGNELVFEEALDYRNEPVLAVSQYVEIGEIGLVVKIDKAEALGTARRELMRVSFILGIITVLFVSIIGFFVSKRIARPIKKLTQNVNEITQGKLDIQLEKSSFTEIQNLTDSLNRILATMKLAVLRTGLSKVELGLTERESVVTGRESEAVEREDVVTGREEIVSKREKTATGREKLAGKREKIKKGEGREKTATGREDIVGKREKTATEREDIVGKREDVVKRREKAQK